MSYNTASLFHRCFENIIIVRRKEHLSVEIVKYVTFPSGRQICMNEKSWAQRVKVILIGQLPLLLIIPANVIIVGKVFYQRKKLMTVNAKAKGDDKRAYNVTKMILSVTLTYIAFTLPFSIYALCCNPDGRGQLSGNLAIMATFPTINASINFYMYFLSAKIFRAEVQRQISQIAQFFGCERCAKNLIVPMDGSTFGGKSTLQEHDVQVVSSIVKRES